MRIPDLFLSILGIGAAVTPLACGDVELHNHGVGYARPSAIAGFDPGNLPAAYATASGAQVKAPPPAGGEGGSINSAEDPGEPLAGGGGGGTASTVGLVCDDASKLCAHLFTYPADKETSVSLRGSFSSDGWTTGVPMIRSGSVWTASVSIPWNTDIVYKYFINNTTWALDPDNPTQASDGFGGSNSKVSAETCDTFSCAIAPMSSFDWRDAVLYFVFVDRFLDGDPSNNRPPISGVAPAVNYQGGDFAGVLEKVQDGYFTGLGVNVLWLTVPDANPEIAGAGGDGRLYSGYHGYWPQYLDRTEERFGTMAELKGLVTAAHGAGIKVILDYAMNHVHSSSPLYLEHPEWFWPQTFNGQSCLCGSDACGWDSSQAKRCWFADYLPDFNFMMDDARKFSVDNAISWVKGTGADGFRLDAVKHIENAWITDLRARVRAEIEPVTREHFFMVGETFTGDQGLIKSYVDPATKLDGQFDFPLRQRLLTSILMRAAPMTELSAFMNSNDTMYGAGIMSTFLGNHDVPRAVHFAEDAPLWNDSWDGGRDRNWDNQPGLPRGTSAFERLANAYTILLTTKGVPLIYYGDEVGMAGAGDPDNRRMMQWDGYSAGQKLLLGRIKKLTAIRAAHPALRRGTRTTISATADTLAYKQTSDDDTVFVAVNRGDASRSVTNLPSAAFTDMLTGRTVVGPTITVAARSAVVLTTE